MIRRTMAPRADWRQRLLAADCDWIDEGDECSWQEGACYELSRTEVEAARAAAREAWQMIVAVVEQVIHGRLWRRLHLSAEAGAAIERSWRAREPSCCARFDFLFDGDGQPKLLELNSDCALSMVETAVLQERWRGEVRPEAGQFNELKALLAEWWKASGERRLHCAWRPRHREVAGTCRFMAGIARNAGIETSLTALHCLGWDRERRCFVDMEGAEVRCCWKLYPWRWMLEERFSAHLSMGMCRFVQPLWTLLAGHKGLLPLLWERFPGHPVLVPSWSEPPPHLTDGVIKPMAGWEGGNIQIIRSGTVVESTGGDFAGEPVIAQQRVDSPRFGGRTAQLGVWMVGDEAAALGIREDQRWIVRGGSPFVPHVIV